MKRHVQLPGIRLWAGEDWLEIQDETLQMLDGFFGQYGMYVLRGCDVIGEGTNKAVSPGLVVLEGKKHEGNDVVMIVRFAGAENVTLPLYLTLANRVELRDYDDDVERPVAYEYYAEAATDEPAEGVPFLLLNEETPRFVDMIADENHQFVTSADRDKWDAKTSVEWVKEWIDWALRNFDNTPVGDHRLIRNEILFNDSRYLPMNGSRVLVRDHPEMPFDFPAAIIDESISVETTHGTILQALDISYQNGIYVGIDVNGDVLRSTDLRNWTVENLMPQFTRGAAAGNGIWIAGGDKGIYRSTDSVTWEKVSSLSLVNIKFGGGVFVAICGNSIYTSYDGLTFEQRGVPQAPQYEVAYHDGLWVAGSGYGVITSTDLVTWTKRGPTSGYSIQSVSYCHDKWICGTVGGRILVSDDGITWTTKIVGNLSGGFIYRAVYYDDKYIVVVGGTFYMTTDFTTWTTKNVSAAGSPTGVLYLDDGGMVLYFNAIVLFDMWYQLPDYSNSDYTSYLKVYEE